MARIFVEKYRVEKNYVTLKVKISRMIKHYPEDIVRSFIRDGLERKGKKESNILILNSTTLYREKWISNRGRFIHLPSRN